MKTNILSIAAAAALLASSCSEAPFQTPQIEGKEVSVCFETTVPEMIATKAFSDGKTAQNLYYAVYSEDDKKVLIQGEATFTDLKTNVNLTLVTNKIYDIIFWAQNPDAPYSFDMATQNVTVDYSNVDANNEVLDAFYKTVDSYQVEGPATEPVVLTRPFAQINVGTNDTAAAATAGYVAKSTDMTVGNVPNVINLHSGEVSGYASVSFKKTVIPSGETFPVDGYDYLEMNYILAAEDKATTGLEFTIYSEGENEIPFTLSNVPVQRNYRTNIYGALLTNPTVWNVEIKPAYEDMLDFSVVNE